MNPYASRLISKEDQELFKQIEKIIQEMPDVDLGKDSKGNEILVSCHMLARAIAQYFPVKVQDGYFFQRGYYHSWLTTRTVIIDVYPIAMIGGPILIDKLVSNPWCRQYVQEDIQDDAFGPDMNIFLDNVEKVAEVVGQTIKKIKESNS